jgi:hypothetical protein
MRKRLPPKPEPPPEGWMYLYDRYIPAEEIQYYCASVIDEPMIEQPRWNDDPSYNWRKKHGR